MKKLTQYILFLSLSFSVSGQPVDLPLLKAKGLIDQQKGNLALALLQNSLPTHPREAWIYNEMGTILCSNGDYNRAIANYLKADSLQKNYSSFYLARTYALMGESKKAFAWLEKHLNSHSKKTELEITSDPAFNSLIQEPEWKQLWMKSWYSESETEINAINALLIKGKKEQAESELEAYREKITPKHVFYYLQAQLFEIQNIPEQALIYINQAIEKHSLSAEYLSLRAELYRKTGKYPDALIDISKAIKIKPITPSYYLVRAKIARLAGNLAIAESDLAIYKEVYPESEVTDHEMALLEKAKGNMLNALLYYDKLIAKNTTRPDFYLERGKIALDSKQVEKADMDFGMALDLNPNIAEAYLQKGNTRLILQDSLGACYCWKKAKQLGSSEAAKLIYQNCKE